MRALRLPVSVALVAATALAACSAGGSERTGDDATARQHAVEARGKKVMPFDQDQTTHIFRETKTGGVQDVVAKRASDTEQVRLVRSHLRDEAARFSRGDFTDPMAIHGMTMPGIEELRSGATSIEITYSDVASGGRITYVTREARLVEALHTWFDAQLADHGEHAHT